MSRKTQGKPLINRNGNGKWQENGSGVASLVSFFSHSLSMQMLGKFLRKTPDKLLLKLLFMWVIFKKI